MDFKLKPCPFCGKEVEHYTIAYQGPKASELEVVCEECHAHIRIIIPEWYFRNDTLSILDLDAVERWNRRIAQKTEDEQNENKSLMLEDEEYGRTSNCASN